MPQNLRSFIIAQVTRGGRSVLSRRSFSSSRRSNGASTEELEESLKVLRTISLLRITGYPLGCYAGMDEEGEGIFLFP
ncbi:unnamed protein product [Microthlaspi erraticum]|uniref:Uncharacterized protein n=1 Tax=Microthlaspi erraticum TaxID=1685480 RepID=A0A6D2IV19_9BRAS|nr:unnamed protein product [Microthlaspi erraticum]